MRPHFSVLCATHNQVEFLPDMLESVLAQTSDDYELIIVDDGSTDGTAALLEGWVGALPPHERARFTVIRTENRGQSAAYEVGFARARGDWVCLLDSDDMFMADKLETIWKVAENSDAGLIQHPLQVVDRSGRPTGDIRPKWAALSSGDLRAAMRVNARHVAPGASGLVIRRDILAALMPMPTKRFKFAADAYLSFGCVALAPVVAIEHALGRYRMQPGGQYFRRMVTCDGLYQQVQFQRLVAGHFGLSDAASMNSHFVRNEYAYLRYSRSPGRWQVWWRLVRSTARDPYFTVRSKGLLISYWLASSVLPRWAFIRVWEAFQSRQTGWNKIEPRTRRIQSSLDRLSPRDLETSGG